MLPQSSIQHPVKASLILLEDIVLLVLKDITDIMYTPEATYRRRRAKWPTLDLPLLNQLRRAQPLQSLVSPELAQKVATLIVSASKPCDKEYPFYDDGTIFGLLEDSFPEQHHGAILKLMYYRCRIQLATWDVFTVLCDRGLRLASLCLREPLDWCTSSQPQRAVYNILICFDAVVKEGQQSPSPFEFWSPTEAPISWLAVMIARACADPNLVITEIETTKILGRLHRDLFEERKRGHEPWTWTCDSNISSGTSSSYFGFWLPHGLGALVENPDVFATQLRNKLKFFNTVEAYYKEWNQIPDLELYTEHG